MTNKEKNQVGAIIIFSIGFMFFGYLLFSSPEGTNKRMKEIELNMKVINRVQEDNIQVSNRFSKTFDELAIGTISGGDTAVLKNIQYKLDVKSDRLAVAGTRSLEKDEYGFVGVVTGKKNSKGLFVSTSILCKSDTLGADGTDPANAPIIDGSDKLGCAPGWAIVSEIQSR